MDYENLLVEVQGRVGLITLNRPQALNALTSQLITELNAALEAFDKEPRIGCMVITGSAKAFAAGADIKEMAALTFPAIYLDDFFADADRIATRRKPVIAAVCGFALGGGCELALMCDFIYAAENACFGQPEINLGVIPGIGGTQRLTRAVGKAKAMEMCMTGRMMAADEAERAGLVARVFPVDVLLEETIKAAQTIAAKSLTATVMIKEAINRVFEGGLSEGVRFERRIFHSIFATHDQKEGMTAFLGKRQANFTHS